MLRLAADENFNNHLIGWLRKQGAQFDLVRVQDTGLAGADDATMLEWAAREGRILLTHDVKTIPPLVYARLAVGQPMPGVFLVPTTASRDRVAEDLFLVIECSLEGEWEGQLRYLPL